MRAALFALAMVAALPSAAPFVSSNIKGSTSSGGHVQHAVTCNLEQQQQQQKQQQKQSSPLDLLSRAFHKHSKAAAAYLSAAVVIASGADAAFAGDKRLVGEIESSGFLFKDLLSVEAFTDPKVQGITLYISDFSRPITERIGKGDFFSDPSTASMTCVQDGPIVIADDTNLTKGGEEVFNEKRNLFTKSIKVRRLVDKEGGNIVYVAYSSKFDPGADDNKSRFKSSLCALRIQ